MAIPLYQSEPGHPDDKERRVNRRAVLRNATPFTDDSDRRTNTEPCHSCGDS